MRYTEMAPMIRPSKRELPTLRQDVSQLITSDKSLLTEKVSRLPAKSLREIEAGIKLVLAPK